MPSRSSFGVRRTLGFSLVELLLTLSISLLISVGVWAVYAQQQAEARGAALGFTAQALLDNADTVYGAAIEFADSPALGRPALSMERLSLAADGQLPSGVEAGAGDFFNLWGGSWRMGADSSDGGTTLDLGWVETTGVPQTECVIAVERLAPQVYDTTVNGQLVGLELAPDSVDLRPSVDFAQALPLCGAENTLRFRRLKALDLSTLRRVRPYAGALTAEERGEAPTSDRYRQAFLPNQLRIQRAMAVREGAQRALAPSP